MGAFLALVRKSLFESRWLLGFSSLALFFLCWLFVFAASRMEANARRRFDPIAQARRVAMGKAIGGPSADGSSTSLELMWWKNPVVILMVLVWPISRGSIAVAGELEKGSLDLVLSRPISRTAFLGTHIAVAIIGLLILNMAMIAGNQVGNHYNVIDFSPRMISLVKSSAIVLTLGLAVFGLTLLFSTLDIVRWRATLLGSGLTLLMFIAWEVANIPTLEDWRWLEKLSIFTIYDPLEAALIGKKLLYNAGVLSAVGLAGIVLGLLAFNYRDLPANS